MKIKIQIVAIVFMLVGFSCTDDVKKKKEPNKTMIPKVSETKNQDLNISFLLDLSDRINPEKYPNASMEYYMRDIAYIKSVSDAFLMHLQRKKVRNMNDRIQLYFDPEPKDKNINALSDSLRYEVTRANATLEILDEIKETYATKPQNIYESAIKDNSYIGSDTWRFFKNRINDLCVLDDHRNILIILTDGYIYHKNTIIQEGNITSYLTPQLIRNNRLNTSNWEDRMNSKDFGFITANTNLEQLEILVLGINPHDKNPYEEDVIIKYWEDWLQKMKVGKYEIKTTILPSNMDKIIKDFILK